jgi:hypothetical protein
MPALLRLFLPRGSLNQPRICKDGRGLWASGLASTARVSATMIRRLWGRYDRAPADAPCAARRRRNPHHRSGWHRDAGALGTRRSLQLTAQERSEDPGRPSGLYRPRRGHVMAPACGAGVEHRIGMIARNPRASPRLNRISVELCHGYDRSR